MAPAQSDAGDLENRASELLERISRLEDDIAAEQAATLAETHKIAQDFEARVKTAQKELYQQRDRIVNDIVRTSKNRCAALTNDIYEVSREYALLQIRLKAQRRESLSTNNVDSGRAVAESDQQLVGSDYSAPGADSRGRLGGAPSAVLAQESPSSVVPIESQSSSGGRSRSRSPVRQSRQDS